MALKAYSLARDGALHLTPHFRVREFACRDGSDPIFVEEELAALLEAIRLHFGCPVAITSGFRTAAHNASIPGASPHSQHLYGRAADFRDTYLTKNIRDSFEINKYIIDKEICPFLVNMVKSEAPWYTYENLMDIESAFKSTVYKK